MSGVDVVIPCFNYGHYLRACAASVLSQQGVQVRAVIIDNASTDQTPEIARELVSRDPRIEYRRHAVNQGHIASFNEGLDWAKADYTVVLPADDLLSADALSRAARLLDGNPDVGLCYGRDIIFENQEALCHIAGCENYRWKIIGGAEFLQEVAAGGDINMCATVVRTSLQRKIGGYRPELPNVCDVDMWARFAVHGSIARLDCCQGFFRKHADNMSLECRGKLKAYQQLATTFDLLFQHYRDRIENAEQLEAEAKRLIAWRAFWAASHLFNQGDVDGCQEILPFVTALYPDVRSSPAWFRWQLKRLLGAKSWSLLRPVVGWLRRVRYSELAAG